MSFAKNNATEGFGLANLPYGSFSTDGGANFVLGARLGNKVVDLAKLSDTVGGLSEEAIDAVHAENLDKMLSAGHTVWKEVRAWLQTVLDEAGVEDSAEAASSNVESVTYAIAFTPGDYVDYYASEHHATNLGKMFRPNEEALKPNWKHLPVGYHGRTGTIMVSGTPVTRPKGLRPRGEDLPSFGPSERLDIECEMGFVVGGRAQSGEVSVREAAEEYLFGAFLFNDWSARDIQNYEYVPLGPNLGKSFASTVGTWVVPWDALKEARVSPPDRDFVIADYLQDGEEVGGPFGLKIDMTVEANGEALTHPPFELMYWTAPQMVAHMTVNGGSLRPGDMFGSGTVSGFDRDQSGSFIEMSWGGKEAINLKDGTRMTFLVDGVSINLTASAPGANGETLNFGNCEGTIRPATDQQNDFVS